MMLKNSLLFCVISILGIFSHAYGSNFSNSVVVTELLHTNPVSGWYLGVGGGYNMPTWRSMTEIKRLFDVIDNGNNGSIPKRLSIEYNFAENFAFGLDYDHHDNKVQFVYNDNITKDRYSNDEMYNRELDTTILRYAHLERTGCMNHHHFTEKTLVGQKLLTVNNTKIISFFGKFKAPIVDGVDLFAKFGLNKMKTNLDHTFLETKNSISTNISYGLGIDYQIIPNMLASIEWSRHDGYDQAYIWDVLPYCRTLKDLLEVNYQPHSEAFLVSLKYRIM